MFDRWGRCLVAWLAACSLLVSSTAAIVHTHEHAGPEHANCAARAKPVETCAKCRHHHEHRADRGPQSEKSQQHPTLPHSHDDCSLCQFLLEHPLPPSLVELPALEVVLEIRPESPQIVVVSARFELPLIRGPPCRA